MLSPTDSTVCTDPFSDAKFPVKLLSATPFPAVNEFTAVNVTVYAFPLAFPAEAAVIGAAVPVDVAPVNAYRYTGWPASQA